MYYDGTFMQRFQKQTLPNFKNLADILHWNLTFKTDLRFVSEIDWIQENVIFFGGSEHSMHQWDFTRTSQRAT